VLHVVLILATFLRL